MKILIRFLISGGLVTLIAYFMEGVTVDSFLSAFIVAVVLSLLDIFIKPLIVLLTLPVTFFTFGLFLLVINAVMILLCTKIVGGFDVDSFWIALLFSLILSVGQSILFRLTEEEK